MRLNEISQTLKNLNKPAHLWSLLIYGDPKAGKTRLAATIAKVPYIKDVHFFSLENGHETLVTMLREGVLTEEQAEKIIIYKIPDTAELPMAMETMMKCLTVHKHNVICETHGKISCVQCAIKNEKGQVKEFSGQIFNISKLAENDVVIIDTASALSQSILNYYCVGKSVDFKPGWDEYGPQGRVLADMMLVIQACRNTNFIVTTHRISITYEENDKEVDKYFPLIGTKNFSMMCGKYFSHIVYLDVKLSKHVAGSSSTYRRDVLTGSRGGWLLEKQDQADLSLLFEKLTGGYYKDELKTSAK